MKLLILGDSHVAIYNNKYIFNNIFEDITIHQCDSDDYQRHGKFTPYLLNTIAQKGNEIIGHYIQKYLIQV